MGHPQQEKRVEAQKKAQDAKEGNLPLNSDLTSGIKKAQNTMNIQDDRLSTTGQQVTSDISKILDTTQKIINEKNENDLLQKAYYHSHQVGSNKSYSERIAELKEIISGSSSVNAEAKENVNSLATIVKLALLSPEFRETINDSSKIINQLLKTKSEKNVKHSAKEGELEAKTKRKTDITEKTVLTDGQVDATVVESKPVTSIEKKKKLTPEEEKAKREEREDKLIERLVDMAQTLHNNPESRNSIEYLVNSASKLKKFSNDK